MSETVPAGKGAYQPTALPDYLATETKAHIRRASLGRLWGHLNLYRCEACGSQLVTTDLDEGTTPFTTRCRAEGCIGYAVSGMYRLDPRSTWTPTYGWYRPESLSGLPVEVADHVRRGGLILRELTEADR